MRIAVGAGTATVALLLAVTTSVAVHSNVQGVPPSIDDGPSGVSKDGTVITFSTTAPLSPQDTDNQFDIYQWSGGPVRLVSTGPQDTGSFPATAVAVSDDGSRVIFETVESLTPDDTEFAFRAIDVYEHSAGVTRLVSKGQLGGNGAEDARFAGATPDARHVFFRSREHLVAGDEDACPGEPEPLPCFDLYEHTGGVTTIVSTGPNEPAAPDQDTESFSRVSDDGTRVLFRTAEALVAADADTGKLDIYERAGGQTTLVSTSATTPNQPFDASFGAASEEGTRVFFRTQERLTADDTDGGFDIFERHAGQTTKVTTGSLDSNTGAHATFMGVTPNGAHVFFDTPERLEPEDDDTQGGDLYRRSGAQTTLISTGPLPVSAPSVLRATSQDGQRVVFSSTGRFTDDDIDMRVDIYERYAGVTTHLSPGNTNSGGDVQFRAASEPYADQIVFQTVDPVEPSDTDALTDLYERWNGQFYRLAAPGGPANTVTQFLGASEDLGSIYFSSSTLGGSDNNYVASVAGVHGPYPRPKSATPLKVALVPAYTECDAPNREHGPPLAFGSCAPPEPASDHLTVGTADSNGRPTKSDGSLRADVQAGDPATSGDQADLRLTFSIGDVRLRSDLDQDYAGALRTTLPLQITDRNNPPAPAGSYQGTSIPAQFSFDVSCATTEDTTVGSTCATTTSADAVVPGAVKEGNRSVWELGQAQVFDGGADADPATAGNTLFAVQGVFVP